MKKEKKDPEKAHFFKAAIPAILFGIIIMKITFYDLTNPQTADQQILFMDINRRSDELTSLLGEEIKRLEVS